MAYQHVNYLWDDSVAATLDPVERLVYRSNLLGSDQRITNTGGGNTSSKIMRPDPLSGEEVDVLVARASRGPDVAEERPDHPVAGHAEDDHGGSEPPLVGAQAIVARRRQQEDGPCAPDDLARVPGSTS